MLEPFLRAVASLILITCLIIWLGRSAAQGGLASRLISKLPRTGTTPGPTRALRSAKSNPFSKMFSGWTGKAPAPQVMTVAARHTLLGRTGVAVVDIDGKRLVLGVSETQVNLITTLETPPVPSEPEFDFDRILHESLEQHS